MIARGLDGDILIRAGHDQTRRSNIDTVRQSLIGQIMIDQANNHPDLLQAVPDSDIFRPVFHKQSDRIPCLKALTMRPVRNLIGGLIQLTISDDLVLVAYGHIRPILVDHGLQIIGKRIGLVRTELRRPFMQAQKGLDRRIFPPDLLQYPHVFPLVWSLAAEEKTVT